MTVAALTCYVLALASELAGLWLLVTEGRKARAALTTYLAANPRRNAQGSSAQLLLLEETVRTVLGNQIKQRSAVALILVGIIAGFVGNLATL